MGKILIYHLDLGKFKNVHIVHIEKHLIMLTFDFKHSKSEL